MEVWLRTRWSRRDYSADKGKIPAVKKERGVERAKGIEPSCEAWKASVLPLNYTRDRT
jgi:hypothetical protein